MREWTAGSRDLRVLMPPGSRWRNARSLARACFGPLLLLGIGAAPPDPQGAGLPGSEGPVAGPRPQPVRAVVTRVVGEVTARLPGAPAALPVRPFQALAEGVLLRVPETGRLVLLCDTGHALDLSGEILLSRQACVEGRALPGGSFGVVEPRAGRLTAVGKSLELRARMRGEARNVPVLLAPRNSRVLTPRPSFQWTEVAGAARYRMLLLGPNSLEVDLASHEFRCQEEERAPGRLRVCSWDWPAEGAELHRGGRYTVVLTAGEERADPLPRSVEVAVLEVLSEGAARDAARRVAAVQRLGLEPFTETLLLAGVYGRADLFSDSMDHYLRAVTIDPAPELLVALGDAHREVGLPGVARDYYQLVLEGHPASEAAAAAEIGLGHLLAGLGEHRQAVERFERGACLYRRLGVAAAAAAAEGEAAEARKHL